MLLSGGAVNSPLMNGGVIAGGLDRMPKTDDWNCGSAFT